MPKLKKLKSYHKKAMYYKYHVPMTYQEMAKEFGVSIDAVKSWFRRKNGLLIKKFEAYVEAENKKLDEEWHKKREEERKYTFSDL